MKPLELHRYDLKLEPDSQRVIIRPFIQSEPNRVTTIIGRALALTEEEVTVELESLKVEFKTRHFDINSVLMLHYNKVFPHIFTQRPITKNRKLLIGALFSGEYALESAALFNPSIVPHPNQTGIPDGALRFVMSLLATGEGHISSIEFRSGIISIDGKIAMDEVSRFVTEPEIVPDPSYPKARFEAKLREQCAENTYCTAILGPLGDRFTLTELKKSIATVRHETQPNTLQLTNTLDRIQWIADSNYELRFPPNLSISERIIFPVSANESNGIEDARFVRFVDDDESVMYYATYTAYNGRAILPQFLETPNFHEFKVRTLYGGAVHNKGMALFPRRIQGQYCMLSRQDDENLLLMRSNNIHQWDDPQILMRPAELWESVKIGNCGSPIETDEGWLVLTHGVGPMRKYCIGAALLHLDDPSRVIGRLREPLLAPDENEREGYVPNVVYSCGSLVHAGRLILPYAMSDSASAVASVSLDALLERMI